MDAQRFRVVWSADGWATKSATDARVIGRPGSVVDIVIGPHQTGRIVFTIFWPEQNRWLGRNVEVEIMAEAMQQGTAADKPMM
jgi:glucoamylase